MATDLFRAASAVKPATDTADDGICHWQGDGGRGIFPRIPGYAGQAIDLMRKPMRLIFAATIVLTLALGFGLPVQPIASAPDAATSRFVALAPAKVSHFR